MTTARRKPEPKTNYLTWDEIAYKRFTPKQWRAIRARLRSDMPKMEAELIVSDIDQIAKWAERTKADNLAFPIVLARVNKLGAQMAEKSARSWRARRPR